MDVSNQIDVPKLEKLLGYTFTDPVHLLTALTHRSYLNENRDATQDHNERLEFLGDAVLELVRITSYNVCYTKLLRAAT